MARKGRIALAVTGVVLVAAGAAVKWIAAPVLIKEPLSPGKGGTSVTVAEANGKAFILTKQLLVDGPIVATRSITGDKDAGNRDVAVWDETLCLVVKGTKTDENGCTALSTDPGLIQKSTDRIAIDRKSAEAVNDPQYKTHVDNDTSVQHEGLGYTFPIGTKKQTYQWFDPISHKAFPAKYVGTQKIEGLTVYKFDSISTESAIKVQGLIPGTYSGERTALVEPTTGVIIKGTQQILEKFASNGQVIFDANLVHNEATVKSQADYAKSQKLQIHLIRTWIPLVLLILGLVCLGLVAYKVMRERRQSVDVGEPKSSET